MKLNKGESNKYFVTDRVFHEEFLGMLEDSVEKNSDYSQETKDKLITVLYSHFYHAFANQVKEARENKRLIKV